MWGFTVNIVGVILLTKTRGSGMVLPLLNCSVWLIRTLRLVEKSQSEPYLVSPIRRQVTVF